MSSKNLVLSALFAALIVVLSLIPPIPLPGIPVPITLQTLGVMLAGIMLGPWRGLAAVLLYVALAALGLPVLPGGRGGLGVFAGPTGGFLVGMILGVVVAGLIARAMAGGTAWRAFGGYVLACLLGGIIAIYLIGVPWLAAVMQMPVSKALTAVAVFLPGDLIKVFAASWVAWRVESAWPLLRR